MRWGASIGSGIGLIVGVFEARAIDRAIIVERERMRREEVQRANDRLEEFAVIVLTTMTVLVAMVLIWLGTAPSSQAVNPVQ